MFIKKFIIILKGELRLKDKEEIIMEGLSKSENSYLFKIEDITVEMIYSKNNKSFNEGILNILKKKSQNSD